jgi:hypothetical protein
MKVSFRSRRKSSAQRDVRKVEKQETCRMVAEVAQGETHSFPTPASRVPSTGTVSRLRGKDFRLLARATRNKGNQ